jgi:anti-sigma regulatory factor (Ser/Thr protein kinase)
MTMPTSSTAPVRHPAERRFAMQFTSVPRGARLARRLVTRRLCAWGYAADSDVNEAVTSIAGELTANAVRHGHVPGRPFHLCLTVSGPTVRIAVTDTRGADRPRPQASPEDAENGRGLLLVSLLAARWAVEGTHLGDGLGKTVWAEVEAPVVPRTAKAPDGTTTAAS